MKKQQIGMYSNEEMLSMDNIISSVASMKNGLIVRKIGSTVNYYKKEMDGSWTNYNCRTVYAI